MTEFKRLGVADKGYPFLVDVEYGEASIWVRDSFCAFEGDDLPGNCGCGVMYNLCGGTDVPRVEVHKLLEGIELAIVSMAKSMSWGKIIFSDNLTNKKRSLSWWDVAERLGAISGTITKNPSHDYETSIIVWEWDIPRKYKGLE